MKDGMMDFDSIETTDDLLSNLPPDENDRWEFKSASILADRGKLTSELGKQVSAFANSGGGNLVFGIADKTRAVEPCEQLVGRQSMKDWLSTMVECSVEYPIRHYRIHEIQCSGDRAKSIFVVAVQDSPAAPHQAKADRVYYYRIDGHTKPAPHFHVELLRNRITKAVLEIENVEYFLNRPERRPNDMFLVFGLKITVKNHSMQSATQWGIHLKTVKSDGRWLLWKTGEPLKDGICHHNIDGSILLPGESKTTQVLLKGLVPWGHPNSIRDVWRDLALSLTPVTQNALGTPRVFGDWQDYEMLVVGQQFLNRLNDVYTPVF